MQFSRFQALIYLTIATSSCVCGLASFDLGCSSCLILRIVYTMQILPLLSSSFHHPSLTLFYINSLLYSVATQIPFTRRNFQMQDSIPKIPRYASHPRMPRKMLSSKFQTQSSMPKMLKKCPKDELDVDAYRRRYAVDHCRCRVNTAAIPL